MKESWSREGELESLRKVEVMKEVEVVKEN